MKKNGLGAVMLALLLVFGLAGCPNGGNTTEEPGTLATIKITNIPGESAGQDRVTFMMVNASKDNKQVGMGFAVLGGDINGDQTPDGADIISGVAETQLYEPGDLLGYLASQGSGTLPPPKKISGSGSVTVKYTKDSDGANAAMPPNTRKWNSVTFGETLALDWDSGQEE